MQEQGVCVSQYCFSSFRTSDFGQLSTDLNICRENLHVFTQNGFEFRDAEGDGELLLSGVPYSKNTAFGKADVQELAQLLMEGHGSVQKDTKSTQRTAINVSEKLPRPTRQALSQNVEQAHHVACLLPGPKLEMMLSAGRLSSHLDLNKTLFGASAYTHFILSSCKS